MTRLRRASVIAALSLLTWAATAHAECAWLLWHRDYSFDNKVQTGLISAFKTKEDCLVKALTFAELRRPVGRESTMGVGVEPIVRDVRCCRKSWRSLRGASKSYMRVMGACTSRRPRA